MSTRAPAAALLPVWALVEAAGLAATLSLSVYTVVTFLAQDGAVCVP